MTATVVRTVTILGICLRLIQAHGRLWLTTRDLFLTLGYKSEASLRHLYRSAQKHEAFEDHVIEVVLGGYSGKPCRLFDEVAVMFICQHRAGREGAVELMRWIEGGGMDIDQYPPAPEVETLPVEEVELLPPPRHVPSLRLVPRGPDPMQQLLEREKAYCRDLVKTFLRYCESEEVDKLTGMIDGQIDHLLETRYCPGLNAARYELYRKYWMQGGGL